MPSAFSAGFPALTSYILGLLDDADATAATTTLGVPATDGWLAAGETWTYASADSPTFTFTVAADVTTKYAVGQRIKLTQTSAKYFIVTAVSTFSGGNTTITVYGGTDYTLANAAITSPYWSMLKAPFGFPLNPAKWTLTYSATGDSSQASPVQNTWYNINTATLAIHIGAWNVSYELSAGGDRASGSIIVQTTLSTANNSQSDAAWTMSFQTAGTVLITLLERSGQIAVASKTSYFLNTRTTVASMSTIYNAGGFGTIVIRAVCAYL